MIWEKGNRSKAGYNGFTGYLLSNLLSSKGFNDLKQLFAFFNVSFIAACACDFIASPLESKYNP